ncbi:hypothetical protein L484_008763 [Morus notabilis]|uniref:Uncharacterized protein n=1 Tax=Morus notabilis TaxID=981085 RepID=W9R7V1_9ROSA|nr:hypothetical protein L484_008763 [Morus notabilis]
MRLKEVRGLRQKGAYDMVFLDDREPWGGEAMAGGQQMSIGDGSASLVVVLDKSRSMVMVVWVGCEFVYYGEIPINMIRRRLEAGEVGLRWWWICDSVLSLGGTLNSE